MYTTSTLKAKKERMLHQALAFICSSILLVSLSSCGDKKNTTSGNSSNNYNNSGPHNGQQYQSPNFSDNGGQYASYINSTKSHFNCQQGGRLQQDVTFHTQSGNLSGQYQPGSIGGQISAFFIGVSQFNDLIYVSKMTNGNQIMGYNVTISMCTYPNLYFSDRPITGFLAPGGISLSNDPNCGFGRAIAMNTQVGLGPFSYQSNGYQVNLPAANPPTTFYHINCN